MIQLLIFLKSNNSLNDCHWGIDDIEGLVEDIQNGVWTNFTGWAYSSNTA